MVEQYRGCLATTIVEDFLRTGRMNDPLLDQYKTQGWILTDPYRGRRCRNYLRRKVCQVGCLSRQPELGADLGAWVGVLRR